MNNTKYVMCISEEGAYGKKLPLTYLRNYKVLNEGTTEYKVENDFGDVGHYPKSCFEEIKSEFS